MKRYVTHTMVGLDGAALAAASFIRIVFKGLVLEKKIFVVLSIVAWSSGWGLYFSVNGRGLIPKWTCIILMIIFAASQHRSRSWRVSVIFLIFFNIYNF